MSELKPTPEPWEIFDVRGHDRDRGLHIVHMPPGGPQTFVCEMGAVPEADVNAVLIKAAPKLLAVLFRAEAKLRYLVAQARQGTLHPQVVIQNAEDVLPQIRAALSKAGAGDE